MINAKTYGQFDRLTETLSRVRSVILTTHINPDGDGLGSQLALLDLLTKLGKQAEVLNHNAVPAPYRFLDPTGNVLRQFNPSADATRVRDADLIIVVDTNHPNRLGSLTVHVEAHTGVKAVFDHHLEPDGFADTIVADPGACATGEMVYRYLEHMDALPPSSETATALYTAIMTDTGSFRFPKTDGDVHRIISHLLDAGADPVAIYGSIYEHGRTNRLHLLGQVLSTLRLHDDGQVCVLTVTEKMFEETATSEIDTDMFVSYGLSIEGVRVALMMSELPDVVKLNVRSKGEVPANQIAKAFGGNGHLNAAGARLPRRPLPELLGEVLQTTSHYLNKE